MYTYIQIHAKNITYKNRTVYVCGLNDTRIYKYLCLCVCVCVYVCAYKCMLVCVYTHKFAHV